MRGGKGFAATTLLIVLLVVAVAGMGAYIFVSRNAGPQVVIQQEEKEKRSVLVTEENVDEVVEQMTEKRKRVLSYIAKMNSEWHFPDGKSPSTDAYVANSPNNEYPVWFDVTLSDGRTVYESPILPLDTYVERFALDEVLEKGVYSATITYHIVDEEQNELTTVAVGIQIIVES